MTDTTRPDGAVQVPLHELLRSVPQDARLEVAISPVHVRFIPVGRLCHEAAAALTAPASKPAGITDEQIDAVIEAVRRSIGGLAPASTNYYLHRDAAAQGIREALSHAKPAEGGVVEMRDTLGCALEDLLDDTQHKHHNCGELGCPVLHARTVVAEWRAALAREGGT